MRKKNRQKKRKLNQSSAQSVEGLIDRPIVKSQSDLTI